MAISDLTIDCPSCGTMLVLDTYNTNICPQCGSSYRKHVETIAFTELLIRSQKEDEAVPKDLQYFRDKLNTVLGVNKLDLRHPASEFVPEEIDDNGDMP